MKKLSNADPITFTPGPYFYQRDKQGCDDLWAIVAQASDEWIATIAFWHCDEHPDALARYEANARLLAASPDMFGALKEIVAAFDRLEVTATDGPVFNAIRYARHAIALADGTLSYRAC